MSKSECWDNKKDNLNDFLQQNCAHLDKSDKSIFGKKS